MSDFRISGLELDYIGPFEKAQIVFPAKKVTDKAEIHIFTGENGAGKTTLLESLISFSNHTYFFRKKNKDESKIKIIDSIDFAQIDVGISEHSAMRPFHLGGRNASGNSPLFQYNELVQNVSHKMDFGIFAYSGYRRIENYQINAALQENIGPNIRNNLGFEYQNNPQQLIQWIANTKTKEALAFRRGDQESTDKYINSVKKIEKCVNQITGWEIEFQLEESPLAVVVEIDKKKLSFDVLPDGLKSIISWIADLLMRVEKMNWNDNLDVFDKNLILLLDEIDVHLHPAWQRKILPVVQELFANSQIFVSTHSPFVVGSVDDAWVYKLKKTQDGTTIDEPTLSENAKSYQTILEEVFGINERFGEEVENQLREFYTLRSKILKGELNDQDPQFLELSTKLSSQSIEMQNIIGMELNQLNRLTKVS